MQSNQPVDHQAQPQQGSSEPAVTSRRRLLRAGLGAAPVVLTFVSQPVRATNVSCTSASAYASVIANPATSSKVVQQTCTTAGAPTWWCKSGNANLWPSACGTQKSPKKFSDCVGTTRGNVKSTWTLTDCLTYSGSDNTCLLAKHLAAHCLNVQSTRLSWLTTNQLTNIWSSFDALGGGSYNPSGLVKMDLPTTINWLNGNYSLT